MRWLNYVWKYRRFEHHSVKEVLLQKVLPDDWKRSVSLDDVDHESFDLESGNLYDPAQNYPHQRGRIEGFVVRNGVLWPGVGAIRTADGSLVEESFFDGSSRRLAVRRGYVSAFPLLRESGAAATLGHLYRNYYHRWSDSISRIYALYHHRIADLAPVQLYIDARFSEDEIEIIHHLLPDYVNLVVTDGAVRVQAKKCIHLPFLSSDRLQYSKWFTASAGFIPKECLDWLRNEVYEAMDIQPAEPFRKLYVTRRNAKVRRLINEEEVATYLQERGFEVVALEERPFQEQVQLFAEARIVVAQHGAGLANLLFARAPRVLEILSDKDRQIFFSLISASHGFVHRQLAMDGEDKNDDVVLPISEIEEGLQVLDNAVADPDTTINHDR